MVKGLLASPPLPSKARPHHWFFVFPVNNVSKVILRHGMCRQLSDESLFQCVKVGQLLQGMLQGLAIIPIEAKTEIDNS